MSTLDSPVPDTPRQVIKPIIGVYRRHLLVCTGPRCNADGAAQALFDSLGEKFKASGLDGGRWTVPAQPSCLNDQNTPVECWWVVRQPVTSGDEQQRQLQRPELLRGRNLGTTDMSGL